MDLNLSGKRALVCGASAGIGRACAEELARLGASVTIIARNQDRLREVERSLEKSSPGRSHGHLLCDLSQPDEADRAVRAWLKTSGPCHILINNTGGPAPGMASSLPLESLRAGFESLLATPHVLTLAVLEGMKTARFGRIINITSTCVKQPIPNLVVSNAIRAAVANWAKTLSVELAPSGITVNNVLPGYTDTERLEEIFEMRAAKAGAAGPEAIAHARDEVIASIPAGRLGRPEEIAAAVAFLASPAAAYINGINLTVDGGRTGCL